VQSAAIIGAVRFDYTLTGLRPETPAPVAFGAHRAPRSRTAVGRRSLNTAQAEWDLFLREREDVLRAEAPRGGERLELLLQRSRSLATSGASTSSKPIADSTRSPPGFAWSRREPSFMKTSPRRSVSLRRISNFLPASSMIPSTRWTRDLWISVGSGWERSCHHPLHTERESVDAARLERPHRRVLFRSGSPAGVGAQQCRRGLLRFRPRSNRHVRKRTECRCSPKHSASHSRSGISTHDPL
jgi:hypothetical protein